MYLLCELQKDKDTASFTDIDPNEVLEKYGDQIFTEDFDPVRNILVR